MPALPPSPTGRGTDDDESDDEMRDEMKQMLEDFPGGAMVIRFDDGDLEMETAMGELDSTITDAFDTDRGGDLVDSLPDSTAVAYGLGFSDGWLGALIEEFAPDDRGVRGRVRRRGAGRRSSRSSGSACPRTSRR